MECQVRNPDISKLCLLSLVSWSFKVLTFSFYQVHHPPPAVRPLGSVLVAFFPALWEELGTAANPLLRSHCECCWFFVGFVKWNIFVPLPESNLKVWMILFLQKGWQGLNHDLPDHGILSNRTWNDSKVESAMIDKVFHSVSLAKYERIRTEIRWTI